MKRFLPNGILRAPLVLALIFLAAPQVRAQDYNRPPADIEDRGYGGPAAGASGGESSLRVDRLESQVRNLNGQVEQLQYQVKRMEDMLRKFQMDVDQRFQERSGRPGAPQRRSDLQDEPALAPQSTQNLPPAAPVGAPQAPAYPSASDGRRHDAFDPAVQASAPGTPRELGSPDSASKPVARNDNHDPSGPLDLNPPAQRNVPPSASQAALEPLPAATAPIDPVKAEYEFGDRTSQGEALR